MPASNRAEYGSGLAVVVVTYSPGETLDRCLDTLGKATTRPVRVILADNGSTDGAPERAAAERENVELLRTGGNLGYGTAANRGVAELDDSFGWVVVANPDVEWSDGALDVLLEAAERWPRGGAFGPLIREVSGEVYPSARLVPSLGRGIGHAVVGRVWRGNPWTTAYKQSDTEVAERVAGWLSGSCLLIRREAFDSVEGFDPRYFMYFEDVDLGDRLAKAGWQNVYVPSAEVVHIQGHSTARSSDAMLAAHHDSAYRFIADRHEGLRWAPVRLAVRAGLTARLKLETRKP
ncbi:glycosyltransferase family 2 protein [Actinophytocola gossypii]|uniref:Glycosyltransferase family 2 protein n=1 Tax=Actinophytocola gossypii TaxID=2812003 RepID=A0ABT2JED2_9PSEU|nr:glycosyltransferase family 2 protein [Actinophytocola gossypii]MCT2586230.1 glycosyltransferase family 2 protein [Actinophytocola gossypii]